MQSYTNKSHDKSHWLKTLEQLHQVVHQLSFCSWIDLVALLAKSSWAIALEVWEAALSPCEGTTQSSNAGLNQSLFDELSADGWEALVVLSIEMLHTSNYILFEQELN